MIWGWRGNQNDESGILNLSFYSDAVEVPLGSFLQATKLANNIKKHMDDEVRRERGRLLDDLQRKLEGMR